MNRSFKRLLFTILGTCAFALFLRAQDIRAVGLASSYPSYFQGLSTASGELYDGTLYTACHRDLPFNTIVRVTNLRNNKSVLVRINDRFPFKTNRVIDVSNAAAGELELFANIAPAVKIEIVEWPKEETKVPVPVDASADAKQ